jgi:hypothetical protein
MIMQLNSTITLTENVHTAVDLDHLSKCTGITINFRKTKPATLPLLLLGGIIEKKNSDFFSL